MFSLKIRGVEVVPFFFLPSELSWWSKVQEDFYGQVCELNSVYMCVSSLCRDAFVLMTKDKDGSLVVEVIQMSWAYWGGYTIYIRKTTLVCSKCHDPDFFDRQLELLRYTILSDCPETYRRLVRVWIFVHKDWPVRLWSIQNQLIWRNDEDYSIIPSQFDWRQRDTTIRIQQYNSGIQ